jgi:Skp family chaperone for outer membrane proteins
LIISFSAILGGKALFVADVTFQHVYRWQQILDKCNEEFKKAVQLMMYIQSKIEKEEKRDSLLETIFTAPQMLTYFQG